MPDYKRKKVHKSLPKVNKRKSAEITQDIKMKPSKIKDSTPKNEGSMRVLKGNYEKKRRVKKVFAGILCFLLICGIFSAIFPVSLGENIINSFSLIGVGGYPCEIEGTVTLNAESKGQYYYVLTDTNIMAFSKNGKQVFSLAHGFASPVLETSTTRALLFDQGAQKSAVYNLGGLIKTVETEAPIITANICRNGTLAIATKPENYASCVTVYNKNFKKIYEWNSAKETVNNLTLSQTGKKIAVSTIDVSAAKFQSNVYVFTYDSADAVFSLNLDDKPVMELDSYNNGFYVITEDTYRHIKWSKYTTTSITATGEIDMVRSGSSGTILVFNRANDRSDNTVVLVSKRGKKVSEFKVDSIINDIEMAHGHVYCASDSSVLLFNKKGENIFSGQCGYGCSRLAVLGSHSVAVINDNNIEKLVLEEKG